jgi:hypothetical protein
MKSIEVKNVTPLGIIALFLALTEIVASAASTQSSGVPQIILVTFVVTFPVMILCLFFLILWKKPYVFYSPKEYEGGADVKEYVSALHRATMDKKTSKESQSLISIKDPQTANKQKANPTKGSDEEWEDLANIGKFQEARNELLKKI